MDGGSNKGLGVWFRKRHVIRSDRCGAQQEEKKVVATPLCPKIFGGKIGGKSVGKWAKITNSFFLEG